MPASKSIVVAKTLALLGFLFLIASTYYLRGEVLALSQLHFSADEVRAAHDLKDRRESYPDRIKQYEGTMKQYDLRLKHYHTMLDLYENDYDEYVKRLRDQYDVPRLPTAPVKPVPPEVSEKLHEISHDFRTRKNHYFSIARCLNGGAGVAALMLVGSLFFLLMFDTNGQRWYYLAALVISFVFLVGPAFHSILTGVMGFFEGPRIY